MVYLLSRRPVKAFRVLALSMLFLLLPVFVFPESLDRLADREPIPELSPEEVVRIQMDAFRNNDPEDRGIEIAFRFASPANKQMTGPLSRFARMIRTAAYEPMLDAVAVDISDAEFRGDLARVFVTVRDSTGRQAAYAFFLARQRTGEYVDCWMTEGVTLLGSGERADTPVI